MLIINEQNIKETVSAEDAISAVEKAYSIQNNNSTYIPDRMHASYKGNTLLLMPGFTKNIFGSKLISIFPENTQHNEAVLSGLMVLNDIKTGNPLAVINGSKLTAVRTGAVGACAVKHLAPKNSQTLGIIGAGMQARYQVLISIGQRPFTDILIYDARPSSARDLKNKLYRELKGLNINVINDANELVRNSDVIITATTSKNPVYAEDISGFSAKCIIAIGSYTTDMQEIPCSSLKAFKTLFVDTPFASEESGDLKIPLEKGIITKDNIVPFSNIINKKATVNQNGLNFFKSVGMSLFDLTVAEYIYYKAIEKGIGTEVTI